MQLAGVPSSWFVGDPSSSTAKFDEVEYLHFCLHSYSLRTPKDRSPFSKDLTSCRAHYFSSWNNSSMIVQTKTKKAQSPPAGTIILYVSWSVSMFLMLRLSFSTLHTTSPLLLQTSNLFPRIPPSAVYVGSPSSESPRKRLIFFLSPSLIFTIPTTSSLGLTTKTVWWRLTSFFFIPRTGSSVSPSLSQIASEREICFPLIRKAKLPSSL
mmetsp:Transcript_3710/g.5264  ORF Transcript_3710/g.5264 Transcript_3710/m.5264 type:complete len:210 (-) Transcript_3710:235-864(-)